MVLDRREEDETTTWRGVADRDAGGNCEENASRFFPKENPGGDMCDRGPWRIYQTTLRRASQTCCLTVTVAPSYKCAFIFRFNLVVFN